jgi:hypothetical protein
MDEQELRNLIPRSKHDLDSVQAVIRLGYPAVAPLFPALLEWLQDINWPAATELASFLASIGEPLAPEIRRILRTDDVGWKYEVLQYVVLSSPALATALAGDLAELARLVPRDEHEAELIELVEEALAARGVA